MFKVSVGCDLFMNSKHLMVVSLILAIVTMGVVSASENITSADALATDDVMEAPAGETPIDEVTGQSENSDSALEIESGDFNASIKDSIDLDDKNDYVAVKYTVPQDANGKVDVYVDSMETPSYSKGTVSGQVVNISIGDLNIRNTGEYHLKVDYVPNSGDTITLAQHTLKVYVYTEKDFGIWYDNLITSKNKNVISHFSYPVTGMLALYVNGTLRCVRNLNELHKNINVYLSDLDINEDGKYDISAKYVIGTTSKEIDLGDASIGVYGIDWDENKYIVIYSSADILNHKNYFIEINNNGGYINGTVSVYVDDDLKLTRNIAYSDEKLFFDVTVDDLGLYNNITLDDHAVKVVYMKDNAEMHEAVRTVEFYAQPVFVKDFIVSVGERDVLEINYIKGFSGTATLYTAVRQQYESDPDYSYWIKGSVYKSVNFTDGVATIPFDSMTEGEHVFILNITDYDVERYVKVISKNNTPGFSSNVLASEITVGGSVIVKFAGYKADDSLFIYLDDVEYNSIPLTEGYVLETFTGLSVGAHRIKLLYDDGMRFYSNTFHITVKEAQAPALQPAKKDTIKLTLKKVKVKKSAKKLVLQVTLKINGKAVKGKLIKFKFNKKTYKAKTNKKGVAKVTIKKKVLKKLKVSKKVTYQATYLKNTVKYTVKVKK